MKRKCEFCRKRLVEAPPVRPGLLVLHMCDHCRGVIRRARQRMELTHLRKEVTTMRERKKGGGKKGC